MKKFRMLLVSGMALVLGACVQPPLPEVELGVDGGNLDVNTAVLNDLTIGYCNTILPYVSSPTRGLVYSHLQNRFDIEELELSMMRVAARSMDECYFRDGQYLSREFVSELLRPGSDISLNPEHGSTHLIDGEDVGSTAENPVIHLAYVLEQNYVTLTEDNEVELDTLSIALALNPYHVVVDRSIGFTSRLQMNDREILAIGEDIAAELLSMLREQPGLEEVPIIFGLYILQASNEVVPGRLAQISTVASGSSSVGSWESINERHFMLPDSGINEYDLNLIDEFNFFEQSLSLHFPHFFSMIGMAHFFEGNLQNLEITVNIPFYGLAEKLSFHQIAGDLITHFSDEYNVTVIVRNNTTIHGVIIRAPFSDPVITRVNW